MLPKPIAFSLAIPLLGLAPLSSQSLDSPRLEKLARALDAGETDALTAFWREVDRNAPLVELTADEATLLVTFLWRDAEDKKVHVTGGRPDTDWAKPLTRLRDSDVWYRTERLPRDARFAYWLRTRFEAPDGDTLDALSSALELAELEDGDRLNDRNVPGEGKRPSYVVLGGAPPYPYVSDSKSPKGSVTRKSLQSRVLRDTVELNVYQPAMGRQVRSTLVVIFDGGNFPSMALIADDLIARRETPPLVIVGVENRTDPITKKSLRAQDLGYSEPFAEFVALELIPWAREEFEVHASASETVIAGASRGAGMAAYVALRYPRVVTRVLSLATALENEPGAGWSKRLWLEEKNGWLIDQYLRNGPDTPLEFFLGVGILDCTLWVCRLEWNRRFRDVLRARGYEVHYREKPGGHDALFWELGYRLGLATLVGRK